MRNKWPARFLLLATAVSRLMSLSGQSPSQETKFPALGHRDMSRPTSLNRGNAFSSKPGI
jgi:hypothetical protein